MMRFWNFKNIAATETEPESVELRIDGEIIDDDWAWLYEWFGIQAASPNAFREELKQYEGKDIVLWIDSPGGSVFAATSIFNALKEHNGKITTKIDGIAASAASVIAMAGDEIFMSPTGIMMIHNPLTYAEGYASDLRKTADVLDEVKEGIMNAYQLKTKKSRNKISDLMDNETYMSAKTAIKEGFADGMLYADQPEKVEALNFSFNRLAIQNNAKSVFEKLKALEEISKDKENETDIIKSKLALQLLL